MNHRRTPEPGHRPRAGVRFAAGSCRACGAMFVLDRAVAPWARARTCSESCRARLGNRGRTALTCQHCAMVEALVQEAERQRTALENEYRHDEDARVTANLGDWMRHYWDRSSNGEEWSAGDGAACA
jgi:hypothetical protein